ncbi:hypothetical protein HY993_01040 [Candidatus Micrarchaeota archaeon]|nr:hypothetical protein [Candidatus Micrarchaeota archaeon]
MKGLKKIGLKLSGLALGRAVFFILAALLVSYYAYFNYADSINQASAWVNPIVTKEELEATKWVLNNSVEREVFATCIFGGELLMGRTLREGWLGGDWAIIPNVVKQMSDADEFFKTKDAKKAHELALAYNLSKVWAPNRQVFCGFSWLNIEREKFSNSTYFDKLYDSGGVQVYGVKRK